MIEKIKDKRTSNDIFIGDRVLSYNESTGETEIKTVTQTFTSSHTQVVKVTHSGGQTVTSSLGHRYFTQRGWIGAEDLRAGDMLQLVNGETVVVEQVQHELLENPQTLYNFSVDGNHNYYVAESVEASLYDFVLAHNQDCNGKNFGSRNEAFRAAKRDLGIPNSASPSSITKTYTWDAGKRVAITTYYFGDKAIRVDALGHLFSDGMFIPRHLNAGIIDSIHDFISNNIHYFY